MVTLMSDIKPDKSENHYSQFRDGNINLISGISHALSEEIDSIIKKQNSLSSDISSVDDSLEALNKIYLSFHSMAGSEELIRLRTLIQHYRSDAEKNSTRLDASHFLLNKLKNLLEKKANRGTEPFRTGKEYFQDIEKNQQQRERSEPQGKFKWITFSRNKSWFISRFRNLEIIEVKNIFSDNNIKTRVTLETLNKEKIEAIDLMRSPRLTSIPRISIRLSPNGAFYAADCKGKEIYADKDFISPMITEMNKSSNPIYTGRVRIFGKNHLYIPEYQ